MERLVNIGFRMAGRWREVTGQLEYDLDHHRTRTNVLYAFVCDGDVLYIGKTLQQLGTRFIGYRTPGRGQSTNIRNNAAIRALLKAGKDVQIFALADDGFLHYGQFHLNLAAGLEDSLIAKIDPEWNGGRRSAQSEDTSVRKVVALKTFPLVLERSYYDKGFFNVKKLSDDLLGAHGQAIEIFLGNAIEPVLGTINRSASSNGTARIFGGRRTRNWFQENCSVKETVTVEVLSPTSIRLRALSPSHA